MDAEWNRMEWKVKRKLTVIPCLLETLIGASQVLSEIWTMGGVLN